MLFNQDLSTYDTDKPRHYLETYEREFGQRRNDPIALLELGVQRGGSILLWQDALPHARIAGLDLNEITLNVDSSRVKIYQGFQQDATILAQISREMAPHGFDVVIDDASHLGRYTAEAFWTIFPQYLKPGGVYIIDDWDCAYRDDWADGHRFMGQRSTVSPGQRHDLAVTMPSVVERIRRRVRTAARPIAAKVEARPQLRSRLERLYMKIDGASVKKRMPSHDYGMAGFGKQLVDACTVDHILGPGHRIIESVRFLPNQIVVRKLP